MSKLLMAPAIWWNLGCLALGVILSWTTTRGGWKILVITSLVNLVLVALQSLNVSTVTTVVNGAVKTKDGLVYLYEYLKGKFKKKDGDS